MSEISSRYVKEYFWQTKIRRTMTWVIQIAAVVLLAFLCVCFFGQRVAAGDVSMEPTLSSEDEILINKAVYMFSSPSRGDVIVFSTGSYESDSLIIKRVIGLPGETILIRDGQIIINGETYIEETAYPAITNPGIAEEEITLGDDEYFVLGDNRNESEDSRYLNIGLVNKENIVGKVWLRYSSLSDFGLVK